MSNHSSGSGTGLLSQRQLRVGELIRRLVSEVLARGDIHDPVLETHVVTIPEVRMTADLKIANIFVAPLGGTNGDEVVAALDRASKWLRGQVGRGLDIKFTPQLRFQLDTRFEDDARIMSLLNSPTVRRDINQSDEPDGEE
jgi:ribosome-binding factor A